MKIGLDVDGVLANFNLAVSRFHNKPHITTNSWEQDWITELFHTIEHDDEFWDELPVLSHPEEITFEFDYYITAVPEHKKQNRINWLKKNGFPDKPVIVSDEKLETMRELGVDVLIDDKYSTIKEVQEAGLIGIHFIPSYLEPKNTLTPNIKHLSQVNEILVKYDRVPLI